MERPLRPAGRLPRPARRPLVRLRATHQGPYRAREGTTGGRSRRVAYAITRVNERELARHVERLGPCATPTEGGSWSWEARMATLMSTV